MTIARTEEEREAVRAGGKRLASVLSEVIQAVRPGVATIELDRLAERLIREKGDIPAFLHYTPDGADRPYPATLCVSINNEVVHGIPGDRKLAEGDIVGLDLGLRHDGFYVDMAATVPVGKVDDRAKKLIATTREALYQGIAELKEGARLGDMSHVIGATGEAGGYGIVRILGGHGIGRAVHETPYVPNYGKKGTGPKLLEHMLLAIEPMFNEGGENVYVDTKDGYTFRTADGSRSAHFEHTVMVTKDGAEILTELPL